VNTFNLNLDLDKRGGVAQWVTLRQGDHNGTELRATIYDHGTQAGGGYTCRVSIRLPGAGDEYYRETATYTNGVAVVTVDEEYAAAIVGVTEGYFELLQGDAVIASTESFGVRILRSAQDGAVPGEKYDSAIEDALAELDEATGRISQMVVDATEEYLEAHPELTTTVEDNSLTDAKLIQHGGILQREQWLETMLPNIPRKATAEADVHSVTDSAGGGPLGISVYGRSTQDGTPTPSAPVAIQSVQGNLLDTVRTGSLTDSGVTWTYHADGTITAVGTATANSWSHNSVNRILTHLTAGTYTASVSAPFGLVIYSGSTRLYSGTNSSYTFTLSTESDMAVYALVPNGKTVNATTGIMLAQGSMAYPYVPYNHAGLLSRSPNLGFLPYANNRGAGWSGTLANGVTIAINEDGSITLNGTADTAAGFDVFNQSWSHLEWVARGRDYTLSCDSSVILCKAWNATYSGDRYAYGSITQTIPVSGNWNFGIMVPSGAVLNNVTVHIQLEEGDTAHAWTPLAEPTVTPIPLQGHALRSLPDGTRDEVTVDEWGHARLIQRVGSVTFDGTENWTSTTTVYAFIAYSSPNAKWSDALNARNVSNIWSNRFVGSTNNNQSGLIRLDSLYTNISFEIGTFSSTAEVKAWLAANPTTMYYPLATPVTIDLGHLDPALLPAPDLTAYVVPSAPSVLRYGFDVAAAIAEIATA
jgi:hypothetical protein